MSNPDRPILALIPAYEEGPRIGAVIEAARRHLPVVVDGGLQGIVSIGDVVKKRIDELESERSALTNYISGAR